MLAYYFIWVSSGHPRQDFLKVAKDSVESDRIDTDEKDHTTERPEDEPVQVECDSSPSNPVVQGVPQIAGTASDQTLSPFRDNRLSNSPEMDSNS